MLMSVLCRNSLIEGCSPTCPPVPQNLLPVTLMFGVCPEESEWLKHLDISQLGEQYDVTVDITAKTRQPIRVSPRPH